MKVSAPIHRLKREARLLSRSEGIPLHSALDRVAAGNGYPRWSLLVAKAGPRDRAARLFEWLEGGDMVLVGARPGQGKTMLCLRLAIEAIGAGGRAAFFSLEYNELQMAERFRAIGRHPDEFGDRFVLDCSDTICAEHIATALADTAPGTLVVVDYLQLLDQRRENAPVAEQVRTLRSLAREKMLVMVFITQIDRAYDLSGAECPDLEHIRLPNPVDLSLFSKACFLHGDECRFRSLN